MTAIDVAVPLRTDAARAAVLLDVDATALLGDEVGFDLRKGPSVRQRVAIDLGPRAINGAEIRWPLAWTPVGHTTTLPAFVGTLTLRDGVDGTTVAELHGVYRPPLGVVGIIVDSVVGQRVAEASVEHFLAGVVRRIDRAAAQAEGAYWRGPEGAPDLRPV